MTVTTQRSRVGIVGYGQMGRFVAKLIAPVADVRAWDPQPQVDHVALAEVAACDIVFLFPPIDRMRECCGLIRDLVRPGAIIVEGCSVMTLPVQEMIEALPAHVDLVGCHPLFGPQSGAHGVAGFKLVLAPVRTTRLEKVSALFAGLGLEVVVMSPEEHDRAMARTQALEQLIGRVLIKLDVRDEPIDVPGYRKLVELRRMLEADGETLFRNVNLFNPFARDVARNLSSATSETLALVSPEARGR
jgi:prephenate dehydrogenase